MTTATDQEYISQEALAKRLGLEGSRIATLRRRTYEGKVPGAVKIFGRWAYRWVEIEKALITGEL